MQKIQNLKVSLKNVGMLDEAEFEVGDLTIICGENNTGKTYTAYSLYGYLDFVKNSARNGIYLFEDIVTKSIKYIDIVDENTIKISLKNINTILKNLFDIFEQKYKTSLSLILAGRESDFCLSEFHINYKDIVAKYIRKKENIKLLFSNLLLFKLTEITEEYLSFHHKRNIKQHNIKRSLIEGLSACIIVAFYPKVFILSAERTGVSMFERELIRKRGEMLDDISMPTKSKSLVATVRDIMSDYPRYPKPIMDNMKDIDRYFELTKINSFINKEQSSLHSEIINLLYKIIGGKYVASEFGAQFTPNNTAQKARILLQCASSSVRSLLMLNLYILNVAQKGDILMIDEPELNLHPNNQILIGRLIALLVNAGVKVFITTHSDYIVRELSNCIMLNNLTDEQIAKLPQKSGYTKEYKLKSSKVKAYMAENVKGKNTLNPVKIDATRGIFMKTFDSPINTQNENQGLIFEEIVDGLGNDK